MTRCLLAALLCVVPLAGAGCTTPPAAPVSEALEGAPRSVETPAFRLGLAPIEVAPAAALAPKAEEAWSPVRIQRQDLWKTLASAVGASGTFAAADRVQDLPPRGEDGPAAATTTAAGAAAPGDDVGAGALPDESGAVFAVPPAYPIATVLDAAFAQGHELCAQFEVTRHLVRYEERNGRYIPNLFLWALFVWPAWYVADERYAAEVEVKATLRAVGSEALVFERTYAARPAFDLDHWSRGMQVLGSVRVPGSLQAENYAKAGETLFPYAYNGIAVSLTADLAALRAEMDAPEFQGKLAHTLAVVAGVGRFQAALPEMRVATDDAESLARMLRDPERGGAAARNIVLLSDKQPTKARLLEAVRERASRGGPRDTVIFYFSGLGFEAGGEGYLAPADLDPQKPLATALSLGEVAKALEVCQARQVVILDASFAGTPPLRSSFRTLRRTLLQNLPESEKPEEACRAALERFAAGRTVILASAPGAGALELSPVFDDKKGLLTARLIDAAAARGADRNRDGRISLGEAFAQARSEAQRLSARAGLTQTPALLGADAAAIPFARAAGR